MVLAHLPREDLKRLRAANREYCNIATPLCFSTINFEMSVDSLRNLKNVASDDNLRLHVKTLVLDRKERKRDFHGLDRWKSCSRYPGFFGTLKDLHCGDKPEAVETFMHNNMLSHDQMIDLGDCIGTLYDRYESECMAADEQRHSLARHVCFRRSVCNYVKQVHAHDSQGPIDEGESIVRLDETLAKFTNLRTF